MKFSYCNYIPRLIQSGVFRKEEEALLIKAQELPLENLIQMIDSLEIPVDLTEKERRRIKHYVDGRKTREIALEEGISVSALKYVHRRVEVMREYLFLYWMMDFYPETRDFDLSKLHSYFSRSVIPRHLAFKHLRVALSGNKEPEWEVGLNLKSPMVNKSTEMIRQRYSNPYLAAVDMYLGIEKNEGPLKLSKPENSR